MQKSARRSTSEYVNIYISVNFSNLSIKTVIILFSNFYGLEHFSDYNSEFTSENMNRIDNWQDYLGPGNAPFGNYFYMENNCRS
jgi:hypothetical protein